MYNCGYYLGACSCQDSCQFYGNCCPDFHDYCEHNTTEGYYTPDSSSCGGHLYGSGSFLSPNYPNYYYDNAHCVWYITAPPEQRVFLTFNDINLEKCCSCDYISVYDGSSLSSPHLGNMCFNSTIGMFHSSSRYLTVLFRTDYTEVGRGFTLFTAVHFQKAQVRKVDCSSDKMNIVIQASYLRRFGYSGNDLYLNDQYCRPQVSSSEVIFNFPLNTCGTRQESSNGKVIYTNNVRASQSDTGEITRLSDFQLRVGCYMEPDTTAHIMYEALEQVDANITGIGHFNASMVFYTSSNFYYPVHDSPYRVPLNEYLYVQVQLQRRSDNLVLFLDTCVASPHEDDFKTRTYDLVRSGCQKDNSYYVYSGVPKSVARFRFQAFKFLRTYPSVYIQCKAVVCQANDINSRCTQGCRTRKARSLSSAHGDATVVLGPIQLKDDTEAGDAGDAKV
ncbi:CUB and zona pellucida-like domain-containing protein 1 [Brienomyrus brachyistius]|uniref:CUB and zona pellucida-like domain-containing protein 1 n=1 Tax=Brienomyrus brachyistius TaxID=42636 RepID=UPI0020B1F077|nr:CUB and zona pellucida-like domain-containing protein 1 [Brienomyrus brachyistius]